MRVSALFLWSEAATRSSNERRRGRLQLTLPLVLQVLVVALVSLALARPNLGPSLPGARSIFVIDTSASMRATDAEGTSRFEVARRQLLHQLDRLLRSGAGGRVSIVMTAPPRLVAAEVEALSLAIDAVTSLDVSSSTSDWLATERIIGRITDGLPARLVVFGDEVPNWSITGFELRPVGRAGVNYALSDVTVKATDEGSWRVAGRVARYPGAAEAVPVTFTFRARGTRNALRWHTVESQLDETGMGTFEADITLPAAGALSVGLPGDDFVLDDTYHVLVDPDGIDLSVLAVGPVDDAVIRAITSIPGASITTSSSLLDESEDYDLVFIQGVSVTRHPGTATVWIGPVSDEVVVDAPVRVVRVDDSHPVTRGLDLTSLSITRSARLEQVAGARTLLSGSAGPLIQVRHAPEFGFEAFLAFSPSDSNWPDRASFPAFIAALADLATPGAGRRVFTGCWLDTPCHVDPRSLAGQWELRDTEGGHIAPLDLTGAVPVEALAMPRLGSTGIFQVGRHLLPVNFDSAFESSAFGLMESEVEGAQPRDDLGRYLLVAAALALVVETVSAITGGQLTSPTRWRVAGTRVLSTYLLRVAALVLLAAAVIEIPIVRTVTLENRVLVVEAGDHLTEAAVAARETLRDAATEAGWHVVESGPDLGPALDEAMALVPGELVQSQIVLAATAHGRTRRGPVLADGAAVISLIPLPGPDGSEVLVTSAVAPPKVEPFRPYTLKFVVHAVGDTRLEYRLLRNGEVVAAGTRDLPAGDSRLDFERVEEAQGTVRYELEVASPGDVVAANNRLGLLVSVSPSSRVAVFAGELSAGESFANALAIHGIEAELLRTDQVPHYLGDEPTPLRTWLDYEVVVLMNVPALELSYDQQLQLDKWVRDYGGGLLVLGGPNTFGPGGYYGTPLEALLPLSTQVPQEKPVVAMAFVLDRSGSMRQLVDGVPRLEFAKVATLEAARLLDEQSLVTVIAFDSEARAIRPLQRLTDLAAFEASLDSLVPGGGTSIYPALELAFHELSQVDPGMSRHIVLMSDGLSQPGDIEGLIGLIRGAGITVSTAAIGEGADVELLQEIARWSGGTSHVSRDFQALPSILAQEALLLSDDPVQTGPFSPIAGVAAEFTDGVRLPALDGYVVTTEKPGASVHLYAQDDAPLLASWKLGLGRVAAFTSQGAGEWVQPWMQTTSYPLLWAQLMRWLTPPEPLVPDTAQVQAESDLDRVTVTVRTDTETNLVASLVSAEGETTPVPLARQGGLLVGEATRLQPGLYDFLLTSDGRFAIEQPVLVNYAAEYDYSRPRLEDLAWLVAQSDGRVVSDLVGIEGPAQARLPTAAWPLWAILASAILLVELFLRYTRFHDVRVPVGRTKPNHALA